MADKKFGKKRLCSNCEVKFYDLNKNSPLICPQCKSEIIIEDDLYLVESSKIAEQQTKPAAPVKDEFADIDNPDNLTDDEDEVISLDDAANEEEQDSKN